MGMHKICHLFLFGIFHVFYISTNCLVIDNTRDRIILILEEFIGEVLECKVANGLKECGSAGFV